MRTVQILGAAPNIEKCPKALPPDTERWCLNNPKIYENHLFPAALPTYTRWFNLHPRKQIEKHYPRGLTWCREQGKPLYLYVPPGQVRNWAQHCARWSACDQPVLFVHMEQSPSRWGEWRHRREQLAAARRSAP